MDPPAEEVPLPKDSAGKVESWCLIGGHFCNKAEENYSPLNSLLVTVLGD
jgi:hypothetical protein